MFVADTLYPDITELDLQEVDKLFSAIVIVINSYVINLIRQSIT